MLKNLNNLPLWNSSFSDLNTKIFRHQNLNTKLSTKKIGVSNTFLKFYEIDPSGPIKNFVRNFRIRYTIWIPLYPAGFVCEGVIFLRNIPYFEETKKFTIELPNSFNFSFHFPTLLRFYLVRKPSPPKKKNPTCIKVSDMNTLVDS